MTEDPAMPRPTRTDEPPRPPEEPPEDWGARLRKLILVAAPFLLVAFLALLGWWIRSRS